MSLNVENSAVKRIEQLRKDQGKAALMLRITVEGGGCSGFQYKFELTDETREDDQIFAGAIVTDAISLPFLAGASIGFKDELIGSEFVITNPNATSGCGCGSSFSV